MYSPLWKHHPPKAIGFVYSPLWKITHQTPSVSCTPPFENITHQKPSVLCTPPFEKSSTKPHRFCVLPPLKNHCFWWALISANTVWNQWMTWRFMLGMKNVIGFGMALNGCETQIEIRCWVEIFVFIFSHSDNLWNIYKLCPEREFHKKKNAHFCRGIHLMKRLINDAHYWFPCREK